MLGPMLRKYEGASCFVGLGKVGRLPDDDNKRFTQLIFCAALLGVSIILLCVSTIGLALSETQDFAWAQGGSGELSETDVVVRFEHYAGLAGHVTTWHMKNKTSNAEIPREPSAVEWGEDTCTIDCCGDCQAASITSVTLVFMSIAIAIPSTLSTISRGKEDSDSNAEKMVGVVGGMLSSTLTLVAWVVYFTMCASELPPLDLKVFMDPAGSIAAHLDVAAWPVHVEFDYSFGVGQWCVVFAAVLQLLATSIQIMVQAPEAEEEEAEIDEEAALLEQHIDAQKKLRHTKRERERNKKARDALKSKRAKAKADALQASKDAYRAQKGVAEHDDKVAERGNKLIAASALDSSVLHHENVREEGIRESNAK